MRYLLDTNIVSAVIRDPQGHVTERIREVGESNVATSIIVAAELRYNATRRLAHHSSSGGRAGSLGGSPFRRSRRPRVRRSPRRSRTGGWAPIGGNDLLIAAHALSLGFTLVTANEREFSKIHDLPSENWLR